MIAYSWLSGHAQVWHKTGIFYSKALTPRRAYYIQFKVQKSSSTYKSGILIVENEEMIKAVNVIYAIA